MPDFPLLCLVGLSVTSVMACAETSACPVNQALVDGLCETVGPRPTQKIPIACRNSVDPEVTSVLEWELTVDPVTITGGKNFNAGLEGVATFDEAFLDAAQTTGLGRIIEVEISDFKATVRVRSGAVGDDVALRLDNIRHTCSQPPRNPCNPDKDSPDGSNTDCLPLDSSNYCSHFVDLPISTDCSPDGICERLEKGFQCADVQLCVTRALNLALEWDDQRYTADEEGTVVFGWADDADVLEQAPAFDDPIGSIGMRLRIKGIPVAFECAMAPTTPDTDLVSFPINSP